MNTERALNLYERPLSALSALADRLRQENCGNEMALCSIINARSGHCSEDCAFCAQSAHNNAETEIYDLVDTNRIVQAASEAAELGSSHFGIVTSGAGLQDDEIDRVVRAVERINDELDMKVCASLGNLSEDAFAELKQAGLNRYNHNVETSRRYFSEIVSTHSYEDRVNTVRAAAAQDISVCCGGIIGMGESRRDRVGMAATIRELPVDSVPINILMPVPGTPLNDAEPLSSTEILKTICVFRVLMPDRTIKVAGGRESALGDFQGMAFTSGANGMIVGDYLTQRGRSPEDDMRLIGELEEAWGLEDNES
ncbi:MAG: biotin synthase BioB [Candidatus Brocadiia bacterium]